MKREHLLSKSWLIIQRGRENDGDGEADTHTWVNKELYCSHQLSNLCDCSFAYNRYWKHMMKTRTAGALELKDLKCEKKKSKTKKTPQDWKWVNRQPVNKQSTINTQKALCFLLFKRKTVQEDSNFHKQEQNHSPLSPFEAKHQSRLMAFCIMPLRSWKHEIALSGLFL